MNLFDLIIIYLACGAPVGVYYYLQNRNNPEKKYFVLKIILHFLFWIPFSIRLIVKNDLFRKVFDTNFHQMIVSDTENRAKINSIQKFFEVETIKNNRSASIFQFRESFEKFVGLTFELNNANEKIPDTVSEFYNISNESNKKIAEICLHRRNRQRLFFHQNLARLDFWKMIEVIFQNTQNQIAVLKNAEQLCDLVNDLESKRIIQQFSPESLQMNVCDTVIKPELELWNSDQPKPLTAKPISVNMKPMNATTNLFNEG